MSRRGLCPTDVAVGIHGGEVEAGFPFQGDHVDVGLAAHRAVGVHLHRRVAVGLDQPDEVADGVVDGVSGGAILGH